MYCNGVVLYKSAADSSRQGKTRHEALIEMNFENKIVTIKPVDS